jgi:acyl carrier protein
MGIMESLEEIKQKSRDVILEVLPNVSSEELLDDKDLFSLGLDSITAMTLVLNFQDAFGVTFETSEISFENFQTLGNVVELIKRKKEVQIPL